LDALSKYKAKDVRDAENIVERITPRLQHANCAVVLSAVKVLGLSAVMVVPVASCLFL
jgi:AP-1 complex subunit beta-1